MNIGEFKNVKGRLMGQIATRTIDLPQVGLRHVQSDNPRAPVYEVVALNVARRWVQIGALWEAVSNATNEPFLQGSLDDPSLNEPLPIALFGSDEDGYRVAWRRPQASENFGTATRGERRDERSEDPAMGGFGGSTAGTNGGLVGADLDDDLPF